MWKKITIYCVIVLGFIRLGLSLYSMMSPVHHHVPFSKGISLITQPREYFVSPAHYEQTFKKMLENDIDSIMDDCGSSSISELDVYIGLLLAEKEKKHPGFAQRNKQAIEQLRKAVIDYVHVYSTFWNQKMSDVKPQAGKREIQSCIRTCGNKNVKPLLDQLMYTQEVEKP
ncbi:MAG: hypothetical protein ACHQVS_00345 [Candidatus Babeliales bacterium]